MPRAAGPEGHRDPDQMWEQRKLFYEHWHGIAGREKLTKSEIARRYDLANSTVAHDIEMYTRYTRQEQPKTFEQWLDRVYREYEQQRDMARETFEIAKKKNQPIAMAQAVKLETELTDRIATIFGLDKAYTAPDKEQEVPDELVVW